MLYVPLPYSVQYTFGFHLCSYSIPYITMVTFTGWSLKEQVMVHGQIKLHKETNGLKNPPRRHRRRNQWCQESAKKNISKKKPIASRIHREELQQEYTNGVKNLPRRITARRYQWRQESAEKTQKKKPMASRHPPRRRNPAQEWWGSSVRNLIGLH